MPSWFRFAVLGLCLVAVLVLAGIGLWGWERGKASAHMLNQAHLADLLEELDSHITAGRILEAVAIGEQLAAAEKLDWRRSEQIRVLRQQLQEQPAATSEAQVSQPTPVPRPAAFTRAEVAFANGDWTAALAQLERLRRENPDSVDVGYLELMEQIYIQWARELVRTDRGEEALLQLEVAKALRESPAVMSEIKAVLHYQESQSYWDTNWPRAIDEIRHIHAWDPDYADATNRLVQAIMLYRERAVWRGDSCLAFLYLDTIQDLLRELDLDHVRDDLQQRCNAAEG